MDVGEMLAHYFKISRTLCFTCCCVCARSNSTQPTGISKQRSGQGVQLHGIIVHSQNGTVYDLSSAFNPEVDEYGTSVPPAFVNGSLCILPGNGELFPRFICHHKLP